LAIVNSEKIERFASIPAEERRLAENLLFNTPPAEIPAGHPAAATLENVPEDWRQQTREQKIAVNQFHITDVAAHFRGATKPKKLAADVPLDQRLANYIIEGSQDGLIADLDRKRGECAARPASIKGPLRPRGG